MQILLAIAVLVGLLIVCGVLLLIASKKFAVQTDSLVDEIDRILPQTQCGQCNYPGCRPYAQAIAKGEADINQCPPGGQEGVVKLAALLGKEPKPLNETHGETKVPRVALIDETKCIGCTLCIQACPVDAILGAPKLMTTVIAKECTGCDLCVPVCPVDCIDMVPIAHSKPNWHLTEDLKRV